MRHLPPVGLPLSSRDVWGALSGVARPSQERRLFEERLRERLPGCDVHLTISGRAALRRLLLACRLLLPGRDEVLIAGYTCWSVAAAVIGAGLKIRLADIDPDTLDFSSGAIAGEDPERLLAVITHHLLGNINRIGPLENLCAAGGAFLIDDAAQGFGAALGGRAIGSFGDGGLLSFGRGKGLPALGGGALIIPKNSRLRRAVHAPAGGGSGGAGRFATAVAHQIFFTPSRYRIPARLPFLGIGSTVYEERFPDGPMDGYAASLARRLLEGMDERSANRRAVAARYDALLGGVPGVRPVKRGKGAETAALRYGVLLSGKRDLRWKAAASRLGISTLYPATVDAIPGLPAGLLAGPASLPGCLEVAESLITLPTHPLVDVQDQEKAARFLGENR